MGMNFQDVLRDVHDPSQHSLKTTASLSASTVYVGNPTLYAVVNTGAAGVGNSIVTINPRVDYIGLMSVSGNVNVGTPTVFLGTPTLYAVVNTGGANTGNSTLNPGPNQIGSVTVSNPITIGNAMVTVTLGTQLDSTNDSVALGAGVANIGFATVSVSNPTIYAVVNTTASSGLATVDIRNTINANVSLSNSISQIGFATVAVSTPTLYAVVNTGAAGVQNSMVTINPRTDYFGLVSVSGNVAVSSLPATPAGANFIGLVTVANTVPVTGTFWQATQPVSGTVAVTQSGTWDEVGINDSGNSITVDGNVGILGNVTITDSKGYIGLTTTTIGSMPSVLASGQYFPAPQSVASGALSPLAVDATGGLILANSNKYIGLISVSGTVGLGTGTLNIGSVSILGGVLNTITAVTDITNPIAIKGNITISDSKGYIGLTTATIGNNPVLGSGLNSVGFATVAISTPTLFAVVNTAAAGQASVIIDSSINTIGFATVFNATAWSDPKTYVGLVTVGHTVTVAAHALTASTVNIGSVSVLGGGIGLNAGINGIGFATVANAAGTQFIGLVTAISRNAGTTKTLIPFPVGLGQNSIATIAVPTNSNKINLTQLILNSNVTTEIAIKSGVTYLTGNASLGVTLFPGGGFVMNGAPDSPAWIGLPSGAMVVEKRDAGGTVSKIGGNVIYFDE